MVGLSKKISEKIRLKQGDITEDEVSLALIFTVAFSTLALILELMITVSVTDEVLRTLSK